MKDSRRPRSGPLRIFLVGYYGAHNTGDEAIRAAIQGAAGSVGATIDRYATLDARDEDPRAVPTRGRGILRNLRAVRRADRVVLGGGGILKDEGLRLPLELLATALTARILRKPVALVAVGVGPLYSRPGRRLVMAVARLASVRTVRDDASAVELRALGVRRVVVGADPVFVTEAVPDGRPGANPGRRRIVLSLRPWFLKAEDRETRQTRLCESVAQGLSRPLADGWDLRLVSLYWPRDDEQSRRFIAAVPGAAAGQCTATTQELDWAALQDEIAAADLVVAMRYHAVAAAAIQGRPVIALAYEPKVRSLAAELGIPAIEVDGPDIGDELRAVVDAVLEGRLDALPDPAAVASLRVRARLAVRLALTGGPGTPPSGEMDAKRPG